MVRFKRDGACDIAIWQNVGQLLQVLNLQRAPDDLRIRLAHNVFVFVVVDELGDEVADGVDASRRRDRKGRNVIRV